MRGKLSRAGTASDNQIGEFIKFANLLMTVTGTSVGDERAFSAMGYVKNCWRSSLDKNLELCVRVKGQTLFNVDNFPYEEVLSTWHDNATRGRYHA